MAHTLIYRHLRPFAHTEPFPLKKKKKKSFQVSHYPSHFICDHRLVQGWNGTRNTKETEQRLGFGGFQGVKFKFVIPHVQVNIKMLQLNSYNSLVNKTDSGQVKSPCSLLNEKGLVNWQDSLLNRWRNAQSPLSVFFLSSSLPHSIFMWRKSNCESLCHHIKSQNKISILFLFSLMAEDSTPSSTLKRHASLFSSYDFGLGWLFVFSSFPSMCLSLTVSV